MRCKVFTKESYQISKWSGGVTTQLAIYPETAKYDQRDFMWRLSSATVEMEESDFTPLPDYDRVLIVLEGEVVLSHKDIRVSRLAAYEQDRFSGGYQTRSFGKITDFNLMVRKGSQGFAEVLPVTRDGKEIVLEDCQGYKKMSQGFYCAEGFCDIRLGKIFCQLAPGELLILQGDYGAVQRVNVRGEGKVIWTQMYYNES
ncbi:HutD family protein [Aminipila butyrica]|uniref:HutD family protein n=1 Tax=Aminipila butyrica TaxID=433296 RepID=A0A858BX49_9FIRM|nr:HutD family protein [Aminipila butyrica]QIB70147.1 HutD family protein [Aminipila butyrica]